MLGQVNSGQAMLGQVWPGYVMLFHDRLG